MGKSLIIKGADFSRNAIDSVWMEVTPVQGFIITNSSNPEYGKINLDTYYTTVKNTNIVKILIPAGKSMSVIIENNGSRITDLNLGYVASQNNVAISNDAEVQSIATNHHPADSSLRESDGSFLIENSSANNMYYYINFCYDISLGPEFPVAGKQVFYKLVD